MHNRSEAELPYFDDEECNRNNDDGDSNDDDDDDDGDCNNDDDGDCNNDDDDDGDCNNDDDEDGDCNNDDDEDRDCNNNDDDYDNSDVNNYNDDNDYCSDTNNGDYYDDNNEDCDDGNSNNNSNINDNDSNSDDDSYNSNHIDDNDIQHVDNDYNLVPDGNDESMPSMQCCNDTTSTCSKHLHSNDDTIPLNCQLTSIVVDNSRSTNVTKEHADCRESSPDGDIHYPNLDFNPTGSVPPSSLVVSQPVYTSILTINEESKTESSATKDNHIKNTVKFDDAPKSRVPYKNKNKLNKKKKKTADDESTSKECNSQNHRNKDNNSDDISDKETTENCFQRKQNIEQKTNNKIHPTNKDNKNCADINNASKSNRNDGTNGGNKSKNGGNKNNVNSTDDKNNGNNSGNKKKGNNKSKNDGNSMDKGSKSTNNIIPIFFNKNSKKNDNNNNNGNKNNKNNNNNGNYNNNNGKNNNNNNGKNNNNNGKNNNNNGKNNNNNGKNNNNNNGNKNNNDKNSGALANFNPLKKMQEWYKFALNSHSLLSDESFVLRLHYRYFHYIFIQMFLMVWVSWFSTSKIEIISTYNAEEKIPPMIVNICLSYMFIRIDNVNVRYISFYRWVHWSFLLLGGFYFLPRFFFKNYSNPRLRKLLADLSHSIADYDDHNWTDNKNKIISYMLRYKGTHKYYFIFFLGLHVAALTIDIIVFHAINSMLQGNFIHLFYNFVSVERDYVNHTDVISRSFPPFAFCTVGKSKMLNNKRVENYGIHLPLMEFYEKVYFVLWILIIFLIIISTVSILMLLLSTIVPFNLYLLYTAPNNNLTFKYKFTKHLGFADIYVLYRIKLLIGHVNFLELLNELYGSFKLDTKHSPPIYQTIPSAPYLDKIERPSKNIYSSEPLANGHHFV